MSIGPNVIDDCEGMTEEDYYRGMVEALRDESPVCDCCYEHRIEEIDFNQCKSCGKPIFFEDET